MKFDDWLKKVGFTAYSFSLVAKIAPNTIHNISKGKIPSLRTIKRLVRVTKNFTYPITFSMFPLVYMPGTYEYLNTEEVLKNLK